MSRCCEEIPDGSHFRKEGFLLARGLKVQSAMVGSLAAGARGTWSYCIHRQKAEGGVVKPSLIVLRPGPQPMEWHCPCLRRVFPSQLTKPRPLLTGIPQRFGSTVILNPTKLPIHIDFQVTLYLGFKQEALTQFSPSLWVPS